MCCSAIQNGRVWSVFFVQCCACPAGLPNCAPTTRVRASKPWSSRPFPRLRPTNALGALGASVQASACACVRQGSRSFLFLLLLFYVVFSVHLASIRSVNTPVRVCLCVVPDSEAAYHALAAQTAPEMQRANLAWVVLQLKALGIDNLANFDFLSPPPTDSLVRALELLYALGALDDYAKLTRPIGETLAEFPVPPPIARYASCLCVYACVFPIPMYYAFHSHPWCPPPSVSGC